MIIREKDNPILVPEKKWEKKGAFNPSVIKKREGYVMAYRAVDEEGRSSVGVAESSDGLVWTNKRQLVIASEEWDKYGCEDPRITKMEGKYYIFYTAISCWPPKKEGIKVGVAISRDLQRIDEKHLVTPFNAKATGLLTDKISGKYGLVVTANTDDPPAKIAIALTDRIEDFWTNGYWNKWYKEISEHEVNFSRLNTDQVEMGAIPIKTELGWLWIYAHVRNYYQEGKQVFGIEAALTEELDLTKIVMRTTDPLLLPKEEYETTGEVKNVIFPSGITDQGDRWRIYYGAADTFGAVAEIEKKELLGLMEKNKIKEVIKLVKFNKNPILTANDKNHWEAKAVFNPAMIYEEGKFYLVYRALSPEMVSTMGCAISRDGFNFDERLPEPIYTPRMSYEQRKKKGNYSGCEDPRITKIGDRFYMCYTAYDGIGPPRVTMTWIKVKDFLKQNFLWSKPILISPPNEDNKDACLFGEKIKGQYVLLHRVGGRDIAIDWLPDLRHFDGVNWLEKEASLNRIGQSWRGEKIGIAGPPIKTERGWLLLYHGVSDIDGQYRVGMMLLDLLDPAKVLTRGKYPILEASEEFEKKGIVDNVVFPCGSAVVDGRLFLYYGGADQAIGVATIKLNKLLDYLMLNPV